MPQLAGKSRRVERVGMYRAELLGGRAFWGEDASMWEQFWFYCCNSHALLSLLLAHPKHPFSRRARLVLLLTTTSLQFAISTALGELFGPAAAQSRLEHAGSFIASFVASVLMAVVTLIMSMCITADDRLWGDLEGGNKRAAASIVGKCFVICLFLAAIAVSGVTVLLCALLGSQPLEEYATVFGLSLLQSWTYIFLFTAVVKFCFRYRSDRAKAAKMNQAHAASVAAARAAAAAESPVGASPATEAGTGSPQASSHGVAAGPGDVDLVRSDGASETASESGSPTQAGLGSTSSRVASMTARGKATEMTSRGHSLAKSSAEWLVSALKRQRKSGIAPAFPFSFGELQRWGRGEDIDAAYAAGKAASDVSGAEQARAASPAGEPEALP
ncbi:hypothetical protein FNF31_05784 [Cafeteria roenbergensis]|uniref:Uncharacterized protein n=1 Tax=Cafeteria roenbergensis TaxID=33653 RepID=A0A5A8CXF1_CAFRO|nr:hypothetical protein FNF31_05784 [Cafeteria roenbergensis]